MISLVLRLQVLDGCAAAPPAPYRPRHAYRRSLRRGLAGAALLVLSLLDGATALEVLGGQIGRARYA